MIIKISDVRKAGHCTRGARRWFDAHGMDFKQFLSTGIDADEFIARGDSLAKRVVDLTKERQRDQGN